MTITRVLRSTGWLFNDDVIIGYGPINVFPPRCKCCLVTKLSHSLRQHKNRRCTWRECTAQGKGIPEFIRDRRKRTIPVCFTLFLGKLLWFATSAWTPQLSWWVLLKVLKKYKIWIQPLFIVLDRERWICCLCFHKESCNIAKLTNKKHLRKLSTSYLVIVVKVNRTRW